MGPEARMGAPCGRVIISATSRDHFAATSVANPLLGEGTSTLILPGVTFKTENIRTLQ